MTGTATTAETLKQRQAELKATYADDTALARQTLSARIIVDLPTLSVQVIQPTRLNPVGLHQGTGGDGSYVCPVELFLAGLGSCAGVTLAAVAHAMRLDLHHAALTVEGDVDFRGTLAVDRTAPVGLTAVRLNFELESDHPPESICKLLELTHRYCVVHRTLDQPPVIAATVNGKPL